MAKKPFVFVIMPFSLPFREVYDLAIKPACAGAGAECSRVDEQIFLSSILERIYSEIARADLIVAEMSGRRENVFYEAGYAHGLGKRVILTTQNSEDIPFDLMHFPHIVYGGDLTRLKTELQQKLRYLIDNPKEGGKPGARGEASLDSEFARMTKHILNHLREKNFTMMSFERIREKINPNYSDQLLLALIDRSPDVFRTATLKGDRPGIKRLS